MTTPYDPDVFDAELRVERSGRAFFDCEGLAGLLGVSTHSLGVLRAHGKIVRPDHYREPDGRKNEHPGSHRRAVWTHDQAVAMLLERSAVAA